MNYIKTSVLLLVLGIIAYQFYDSDKIDPPPHEHTIKIINQSTIDSEINLMGAIKNLNTCIQRYKDIKYEIDNTNFNSDHAVSIRIGQTLNSNLYAAYASRFIFLAEKYLTNQDWSSTDVRFIQNASNDIMSSPLWRPTKDLNNSFQSINDAMNLRGKIQASLNSVSSIGTTCTSINNDFPDYSSNITASLTYLTATNINPLFSHCALLKSRLRNVSKDIFDKHVTYLESMIRLSDKMISSYTGASDFSDYVYTPVLKKIGVVQLYNKYGISISLINQCKTNLKDSLDKVYTKAYNQYQN
jgi:hypothetical protein